VCGDAVKLDARASVIRASNGTDIKRETTLRRTASCEEVMTVFGDALGRIVQDERHSFDEPWLVLIGESVRRRLLVVMSRSAEMRYVL